MSYVEDRRKPAPGQEPIISFTPDGKGRGTVTYPEKPSPREAEAREALIKDAQRRKEDTQRKD